MSLLNNRIVIKVSLFLLLSISFSIPSVWSESYTGLCDPIISGNTLPFWILTSNDAFGLDVGGEWDDRNSFGFKIGFGSLPWNTVSSFSMTGYTNRGGNGEESFRTDKLEWSFQWNSPEYPIGRFHLNLRPGGGLYALGNFGGYHIQSSWHSVVNVKRPIPAEESYRFNLLESGKKGREAGKLAITPYINGEIVFGHQDLSWIKFKPSFRLDPNPAGIINLSLELGRDDPFVTRILRGGYIHTWSPGEFKANAVYPVSSDCQLEMRFRIGSLYIERSRLLLSGQNAGSLGFLFINSHESGTSSSGGNERLDIGTSMFTQSTISRWGWDLASLFPDLPLAENRIWVTGSFQSGWNGRKKGDKNQASRFTLLDMGTEFHFFAKRIPLIDPYLHLSAGLHSDRLQSMSIQTSSNIMNNVGGILKLGGGSRFYIPDLFPNRTAHNPVRYFIGFEGGLAYKPFHNNRCRGEMSFITGAQIF